jgi:very-short-patch-repair endonuclease
MDCRMFRASTKRARDLRGRMPPAEVKLWNGLRNKQLGGLRFRRQHPIGPYFLDFFCSSCGLAIEVDGASHDSAEDQQADERRDLYLARYGVRVIRFLNADIMKNLEGVLQEIVRKATGREWDEVQADKE